MNDIPCNCGHKEKDHQTWHSNYGDYWCPVLKYTGFNKIRQCGCLKYIQDNLSYIEILAKKKNLI
jgi:hypothetical protein